MLKVFENRSRVVGPRYFGKASLYGAACACLLSGSFVHAQTPSTTTPAPTPITQAAETAPLKIIEISFQPAAGHGGPVITATLNNKVTCNLLFDTGSNISVISPDVATQLGLKTIHSPSDDPHFIGSDISSGALDSFVVKQATGSGNGLILSGDYVGYLLGNIISSDAMGFLSNADSRRGVLGGAIGVHAGMGLVFDFERNRMQMIYGGHLTDKQLLSLGFVGGLDSGIPFELINTSILKLHANLQYTNGQKVQTDFILDTGSDTTSISSGAVLEGQPSFSQRQVKKVHGAFVEHEYRLESLCLGETSAANSAS